MIHFELLFVYSARYESKVFLFCFTHEYLFVLVPCWKGYLFFTKLPLHLCWKSVVHILVGLFLKSLNSLIELFVYLDVPFLITVTLKVKVKVSQSCPTLCDPMDYMVHGILQARILEWVAFPFTRGSSQPRDWTQVSRIAGGFFTSWATREAQEDWCGWSMLSPADLADRGIKPGSSALRADSLPTELSGKLNFIVP